MHQLRTCHSIPLKHRYCYCEVRITTAETVYMDYMNKVYNTTT